MTAYEKIEKIVRDTVKDVLSAGPIVKEKPCVDVLEYVVGDNDSRVFVESVPITSIAETVLKLAQVCVRISTEKPEKAIKLVFSHHGEWFKTAVHDDTSLIFEYDTYICMLVQPIMSEMTKVRCNDISFELAHTDVLAEAEFLAFPANDNGNNISVELLVTGSVTSALNTPGVIARLMGDDVYAVTTHCRTGKEYTWGIKGGNDAHK